MVQGVYELGLLGPVEIVHDGELVRRLTSQKTVALLGYLAVNKTAISRSVLADLFWGNKSEARGRASLSVALHDISSSLPDCLYADRQVVQFQPHDLLSVDVLRFEAAVKDATPTSLEHAFGLYRGEFMMGLALDDCLEFEAWLMMERERWRQRVSDVLQQLVTYYSDRGEYQRSLHFARQLEQLEPWREEIHRHIMFLLALEGQRSAALVQYETCCRLLAQELGVEPSEETSQLYEQIRTQTLQPQTTPTAPSATVAPFIFAGRQDERAWLLERWQQVSRGARKLTLLEGEAGIGKTRLVEEVLRYVGGSAVVLRGRCYPLSAPVPYQPIAVALRSGFNDLKDKHGTRRLQSLLRGTWVTELTQLLPEVQELYPDVSSQHPASSEAVRHRLFEATAQYLKVLHEVAGKLVMFIDDLQWVDEATVDLLTFLFDRLRDVPIWFLGAYRPMETENPHPLLVLRRALAQQNMVAVLRLEPLPPEAIAQLVQSLADFSSVQVTQLTMFLSRKSEGNALIVTHYLEYFQGKGILQSLVTEPNIDIEYLETLGVPFTVQETVLSQLSHLSSPARELLEVAAVIGHQFDPRLLHEVAADSAEEVRRRLEQCRQRGIISFKSPTSYTFVRTIVRDVIYQRIPEWHRSHLQTEVAAALKRLSSGQ